jgi:hypothetical protein
MAKERKSPQEKKQLEYNRDHFTFGWNSSRSFPQRWNRKKARLNRQFRRKSEHILAEAKPGVAAEDVDRIADDLTAARFQKSVSRKRLRKTGTVTVGEKVRSKLERRAEAVGRRVRSQQRHEEAAISSANSAVPVLNSLRGEELVNIVRRADQLCNSKSAAEFKLVLLSKQPVDRALYFLYRLSYGSAHDLGALRQNPELEKALGSWMAKANRILERERQARDRELAEKKSTRVQARKLAARS